MIMMRYKNDRERMDYEKEKQKQDAAVRKASR